jgi:hypothetical protein
MPKKFYDKMWRTIKTDKQPFVGELKNKKKNGQIYDAEFSISPILNDNGEIIYFVGVERDITKAKEIESNVKNRVNEFWLADGESAIVQFYADEPYCTEGHTIQQGKQFPFVPCQLTAQRHCLMCEESLTPSWKAIFKVADHRGTWDKDKKRFKYDKIVEKVWLMPAALTEQLRTYVEKKRKNLSEVVLEVTRTGSGTKSTYNIDLAWDEDADRPIKPSKLKSELPDLEEIYAPPTDDYVVEHYI